MVHGSVRWLEYICYVSGVCMHSHWGVMMSRALGLWLSAHVSCTSVYLSANDMISTVCSCIGV